MQEKDTEIPISFSLSFDCQRSVRVRYCFSSLIFVFLGLSVINIIPDIVEPQQSMNSLRRPTTNKTLVGTNQLPKIEGYAQYKYNKTTEGLKLIWLMSFPNSGTTYTSQLIRETTKTIAATNYANEMPENNRLPVYDDMPEGPFWYNPESNFNISFSDPKEYVITKTHCGGRCLVCSPEKYGESTYSFRQRCFTTERTDHADASTGKGTTTYRSTYGPDRLQKVIHIFRDPFDNIVSRFQFDRKVKGRLASNYSNTRAGFRKFCRAIDSRYKLHEERIAFLNNNILEIMKIVPCRADFFRYVEWHNQAFVTTHDLDLDMYILKYDHYTSLFNETLNEILDFIHLPFHKDGHIPPFISGKVYREYFTMKEQRAVAQAFEIMSSAETWFHIKPYFKNLQ